MDTTAREINSATQANAGPKESATIIIFGASGDLTARKLVPALYALWKNGYLADEAPIVGVARREMSDESYREEMLEAVRKAAGEDAVDPADWQKFAERLYYREADLTNREDFIVLRQQLEPIEEKHNPKHRRLAYLATAPGLFLPTVQGLGHAGMIPDPKAEGWLRVVIEKPFGHDLASAQELDHGLGSLLDESQIYRIDHYLGKETVQNILLFRFGNAIFEPLFNRTQVDHVQISVAESQGIEAGRGAYYDKSGALRDVLQNHVLQLLCLIAMEPPALFNGQSIRDEKKKVLEALAPANAKLQNWAIAGQYTEGTKDDETMVGYRQEDRVAPDSCRETYVAMDVRIENWRWAGVPFYLRTGKRMPSRVTEIAVQFKEPPKHLFTTVECEGDICDLVQARPNTLVFRIQPKEAISLRFSTKRPGMQYQIQPVTMDFAYEDTFEHGLPEAYERLLLEALRGDSTLFTRSDELETAWRFVTPVLEAWEKPGFEPEPYPAGRWGPKAADELLTNSGRHWRQPTPSKT
jgi:glucose-6-phosphate 1-dehydrogenase